MAKKKKADLAAFQVKPKPAAKPKSVKSTASKSKLEETPRLICKGFQITPEAAQQFDILKAELGPGNKGPELIAEALNLLFEKYGKPPIA